ncbi:hypothetical protein [Bacillus sp. MRMR6]|uniref:hypothetical protein n=1 Tax=Bacillus sp. MRMR6 TaxID=1928617 RepID=UPI00158ADF5C|nr:hypothetical protein [Bacillus sp. MRMR6]
MKKVCCDKVVETNSVYWNPYNEVVQCHNCGHVYTPSSKLKYFLNRLFKWWV